MWWPLLEPGSSAQKLYKMVSEFLIGRLGEHGLFPEMGELGSERTVSLRDGIKCGLGQVAQGGSAAPG